MRDKTRFNQFLDSIEGINPKILSARLKEMEKSWLIRRKVYSTENPVRIGYFLTEKGNALKSILDQMAIFHAALRKRGLQRQNTKDIGKGFGITFTVKDYK